MIQEVGKNSFILATQSIMSTLLKNFVMLNSLGKAKNSTSAMELKVFQKEKNFA
jgi:hypothetical protein